MAGKNNVETILTLKGEKMALIRSLDHSGDTQISFDSSMNQGRTFAYDVISKHISRSIEEYKTAPAVFVRRSNESEFKVFRHGSTSLEEFPIPEIPLDTDEIIIHKPLIGG